MCERVYVKGDEGGEREREKNKEMSESEKDGVPERVCLWTGRKSILSFKYFENVNGFSIK